jgi:hypothetical protein
MTAAFIAGFVAGLLVSAVLALVGIIVFFLSGDLESLTRDHYDGCEGDPRYCFCSDIRAENRRRSYQFTKRGNA